MSEQSGRGWYRANVSIMGLHPGEVVQLEDSPRMQGLVETGMVDKVQAPDQGRSTAQPSQPTEEPPASS